MVLVVGAALAAACSSFSSEPSSSPPGGADASGDVTATGNPPPAPPSDAASDAAAGEGSTPFCNDPGAHDLCEDFDEHTLAADGWQSGEQSTPDAGLTQIDPGQSTSPPLSLLVGMSTKGFLVQRSFFLHRNVMKPVQKTLVIAFDLYVDTLEKLDAATNADSLIMTISDGSYANQIRVANAAGLLDVSVIEAFGAGTNYQDARYTFGANTFQVQRWHRFVLTVDHTNTTIVGLSIDGAQGAPPSGDLFHVPPGPVNNLGLELGTQSDQSGETIKTYFDNVTVDIDR
jgi:hypothetical protein